MIRKLITHLAMERGRAASLYKRVIRPGGKEWAEYLRRHGGLYHLGMNCSILSSTNIVDPQYTWIGNRVCLGSCALICHDGSIEVIHQRYGLKIDRIGPIIIRDDVYVGEAAIILGGVTIGEGSIIGAGAVVRSSVPSGSVVMGNPSKIVAKVDDLLRFWQAECTQYPWADLIAKREGAYDAAMEPELCRLRQEYFFANL